MKKHTRKFLCAVLAVMMVVSLIPVYAAADDHDHNHTATLNNIDRFLDERGLDDEGKNNEGGASSDAKDGESEEVAEGCDHDWVEYSTDEGYNCQLGTCWMYYWECSKCGAQRQIAFREYDGLNLGQHTYTEKKVKSECPKNPTIERTCKDCGDTQIETGKHNWQPEGPEIPGARCTDYSKQKYVCADCGATKTESTGVKGTHNYVEMSSKPTCTEPGYTWKECTGCGHVILKTATGNPTGHKWTTNADHTVGRTCSVCGMTSGATEHTWSGWQSDENAHWKECTQCKTMDFNSYNEHTFNAQGKCTVCGHSKPVCDHDWVGPKMFGPFNHQYECSICKEKMTVSCASVTSTARDDCTKDVYCVCGNKVLDGQKRHNFGTWNCTDSSHTHKCLNIGCQYGQTEPHNFATNAGVVMCSVCSFVDKAASVEHTHTYGPWTVGQNSCVKYCTDPTCGEIVTTSHIAGAADCLGNATCKLCGAAMKAAPSSNHVGATEIRNAAAAEVGKAGYTGDTVCLTCGQIIQKGQPIEALKPNHVHAFTAAQHDATGHWNVCECGEKDAVAVHTGGAATCASQAVCSVCGEKYGALSGENHVGGTQIINIIAAEVGKSGYTGDTQCLGCGAILTKGEEIPALTPEHQHAHTVRFDSVEHWKECECGDKIDAAAHTYANGICSVCGAKEPEKIEDAHVHSYSASFDSTAEYHWHTCAACGGQNGLEKHMFVDDRCVTCGMTLVRSEVKEAREKAQADLTGENSVLKIFKDMADATADTYYALPIQRLYNAGIMKGNTSSGDSFGGASNIRRDSVMVIMARISGQKDVDPADWNASRAAFMQWAAENDVTVPGPEDADASREETVYMLWVMAGKQPSTYDLSAFTDVSSIESDYMTAIRWAVENDILTGDNNGKLMPDIKVTRQDAATLVVRYIDRMNVVL